MFRKGIHILGKAGRLYLERRAHHSAATIGLFSFILLFPLAVFLTAAVQSVDLNRLQLFLQLWMPVQIARVIINILSQAEIPQLWEIGLCLLVAVWGLSHVLHSVIEISDEFYEYHERHFWHGRLLALIILVILMLWQFVTISAYTIVAWFGELLLRSKLIPWPGYVLLMTHWASTVTLLSLHWVSLVLTYGMVAPQFHWRENTQGALFTALTGWLVSRILVFYIGLVPIGDVYGALTNFVVFIIWVYWEATIFIMGIGINKILLDRKRARIAQATECRG